jgi:ABC-2 type transport system ATP-binding protein
MTTILQADNIRVEFGSLVAVDGVSFELAGGQLLGLIGPNGAGKTTLLRVLAGLHAPTHGIARIMGQPVLGEHEVVRHHVGFAPDTPPAYDDLTIDQFLRFIAGAYRIDRDEAEERIDFWLEQLWLTDKRATLIKNLSRGMRQRVTLARTFVPRPHVLLLDEPLIGLDPAGRIQLRNVLAMLRDQGCAMIVSSRILSDLEEVATHIAIIEHGRILRWSGSDDFRHHQDERRLYRMEVLDDMDKVSTMLGEWAGVSNIERNGRAITFSFSTEDREAAKLLKTLIERGANVISFNMVRTTLEEAYLRSGVKQVD